MSLTDAIPASDIGDEMELPDRLDPVVETAAPALSDHARSGNLAVVTGVVSLLRAGRTFLRGDRKRGAKRALIGIALLGLAVAQRRRGSAKPDLSDVADTGPDVESAVDPDDRETDRATGEDVVDTTDADVEESDTAPELDSDVESQDVDQRDVAGSSDIAESTDDEADSESDADEARAESADDEDDTETSSAESDSESAE
ncbi:hypothetical protein BRC82_10590 [Halobacteriales archaeon QS_1_67_19]|nr:MAG: hypothetical protein BRC82_10590 [Halobacteriales archaeon QS_1_67_19]